MREASAEAVRSRLPETRRRYEEVTRPSQRLKSGRVQAVESGLPSGVNEMAVIASV